MGRLSIGVLTDRARVLRGIGVGERVEGRTPVVTSQSVWVPARLVSGAELESADARRGRHVMVSATIVLRPVDEVLPSDRIEIEDGDVWSIVGVEVVRGHRGRSLGFVAQVERVVQPVRETIR